jgi:hypothetical protein
MIEEILKDERIRASYEELTKDLGPALKSYFNRMIDAHLKIKSLDEKNIHKLDARELSRLQGVALPEDRKKLMGLLMKSDRRLSG